MKIKIVYTYIAMKELKKLDKNIARMIVSKMQTYTVTQELNTQIKKLNPPLTDLYRIRVGVYRVIIDIEHKDKICLLTILSIKHRKDVYA